MSLIGCPTCRKQLPQRARFCSRCGSILVQPQRSGPLDRVPLPSVPREPEIPIFYPNSNRPAVNPLDYETPRRRQRRPRFSDRLRKKGGGGRVVVVLLVIFGMRLVTSSNSSSSRSRRVYSPPPQMAPQYVRPPAVQHPNFTIPPLPRVPPDATKIVATKPQSDPRPVEKR
jgi:hypothetical protein